MNLSFIPDILVLAFLFMAVFEQKWFEIIKIDGRKYLENVNIGTFNCNLLIRISLYNCIIIHIYRTICHTHF